MCCKRDKYRPSVPSNGKKRFQFSYILLIDVIDPFYAHIHELIGSNLIDSKVSNFNMYTI